MNKLIARFLIVAFAAFFMSVASAATAVSPLEWTEATKNTDGSDLTDLAGTYIYVKRPGDDQFIQLLNEDGEKLFFPAGTTSFDHNVEYPDGIEATIQYYITHVDDAGNESDPSGIVSRPLDSLSPASPELTITISLKFDNFGSVKVAQVTTE